MADIKDKVNAKDDISFTLEDVSKQPERKEYEVVNPLFKNGKEYKKGDTIELDELTASNFKKTGDIQ